MSLYVTLPVAASHQTARFPKVSNKNEYTPVGNLATNVRGNIKICQIFSKV